MRPFIILAFCLFAMNASAQTCTTKSYTNDDDYIACVGNPYSVSGSQVDMGTGATNDPYSRYQWWLSSILEGEDYDTVWGDLTTDVRVAVIDSRGPGPGQFSSGLVGEHPDLTDRYARDGSGNILGWNFVSNNGDTSYAWDGNNPGHGNGHGMCVTSIIAGEHDTVGMAGASAHALIMPIHADFAHLSDAIDWAVANGAKVISLAGFATDYVGGVSIDQFWYFKNLYPPYGARHGFLSSTDRDYYVGKFREITESLENAAAAGVIVVVPIGNQNGREVLHFTGANPNVITVGSYNINDEISPYNTVADFIDVFAPGGDRRNVSFPLSLPSDVQALVQATGNGDDIFCAVGTDRYSYGSGTSFAHPVVEGIIADMASCLPNLDVWEARRIIREAARTPTVNMNVLQSAGGNISSKAIRDYIDANLGGCQ